MNLSFKRVEIDIPRGDYGTKILDQLKSEAPKAEINKIRSYGHNPKYQWDVYKIDGLTPHEQFHLKERIQTEPKLSGCGCSTCLDDKNLFGGIFNVVA